LVAGCFSIPRGVFFSALFQALFSGLLGPALLWCAGLADDVGPTTPAQNQSSKTLGFSVFMKKWPRIFAFYGHPKHWTWFCYSEERGLFRFNCPAWGHLKAGIAAFINPALGSLWKAKQSGA
jgi:hypothetical protein